MNTRGGASLSSFGSKPRSHALADSGVIRESGAVCAEEPTHCPPAPGLCFSRVDEENCAWLAGRLDLTTWGCSSAPRNPRRDRLARRRAMKIGNRGYHRGIDARIPAQAPE